MIQIKHTRCVYGMIVYSVAGSWSRKPCLCGWQKAVHVFWATCHNRILINLLLSASLFFIAGCLSMYHCIKGPPSYYLRSVCIRNKIARAELGGRGCLTGPSYQRTRRRLRDFSPNTWLWWRVGSRTLGDLTQNPLTVSQFNKLPTQVCSRLKVPCGEAEPRH